jgi:hypothetical protein
MSQILVVVYLRDSLPEVPVAPVMGGSGAARLRAFGDGLRAAKAAIVTRPAIWSPQTA